MSKFDVNVNGEELTVYPKEDGSFKIWKGSEKIADIYPDISISTRVVWGTADLIPKEYAQAIGEAIERAEM